MLRSSKIVKLRSSGLEARISVLSKSDISGSIAYICSENLRSFQIQIMYMLCENYLTEIIPNIVGKDKKFRELVFNELYKSIVELNPDISRIAKPETTTLEGGKPFSISFIASNSPQKKSQSKSKKTLSVTPEKVSTIAKSLGKVVFGQTEVLDIIQEYFECSLAGISDDTRPRGAFMFVGDTGTGKTMVVKEIAKHFWGDKWREGLYIVNGSEMMEEHETARLLGSPQGYVGYEDGSSFLKHVGSSPESIVLVDEFEKAHPKMQDIFLQILEEGFCNDNKGNRIDFSKTFIIFTSNIGTKDFYHKNHVGFGSRADTDVESYINSAVSKFCRIEFLKRFDGIVVFNILCDDSKLKIVKAQVDELGGRLKSKGFGLSVDEGVYSYLLNKLETRDTSRDIRTLVKKSIGNKVAKIILTKEDFDFIQVSLKNNDLLVRGVCRGKKRA